MDDFQRALGRIEGIQSQILSELSAMRGDNTRHRSEFTAHQRLDLQSLSILEKAISKQREDIAIAFSENDRARNQHLNEQDVKLDALKTDSDRAKGAGWVILSMLGFLATIVGGAVIAAIEGVIKIRA